MTVTVATALRAAQKNIMSNDNGNTMYPDFVRDWSPWIEPEKPKPNKGKPDDWKGKYRFNKFDRRQL